MWYEAELDKLMTRTCLRPIPTGKVKIKHALIFGIVLSMVSVSGLYLTGVSVRLGKTGDSSSIMDYDPAEIKRGHSINSSLAFLEFNSTKINLLDTPGSNNFIGDTPAAIRVIDGLVFVISATEGVQFYTEKIWKWADELDLPRIIFLNKMDHERANTGPVIEAIKNKFKKTPIFIHLPQGEKEKFSGIVDLVQNKFFSYDQELSLIHI